jgi:hypothetical protein
MTHDYSGKYAAKHPPDTSLNRQIAEEIRKISSVNGLSCVTAEEISKELEVDMSAVGIAADLMEIKIKRCQLGLFGYDKKPNHGKDIQAAGTVPDEMKKILEETAENGAVTCVALWTIARRLGVKRKAVSTACETLNLKIRACQLGAF